MNLMNREDVIRDIQERYRQAGRSLNELQRRHWAAVETRRIGRGGISIVSEALRISPNTIKRGIRELDAGLAGGTGDDQARIRRPGGGRKSKRPSTASSSRNEAAIKADGLERDLPAMNPLTAGPTAIESASAGVDPTMP